MSTGDVRASPKNSRLRSVMGWSLKKKGGRSAERNIGDGDGFPAAHMPHVTRAEIAMQLAGRHALQRARRRADARRRLRVRGGTRGVKSDLAFHLSLDLMDVAVQYR